MILLTEEYLMKLHVIIYIFRLRYNMNFRANDIYYLHWDYESNSIRFFENII